MALSLSWDNKKYKQLLQWDAYRSQAELAGESPGAVELFKNNSALFQPLYSVLIY